MEALLCLCVDQGAAVVFNSIGEELSSLGLKIYKRDELDSAQDLPLQCYIWALYVGLVGAVSIQYIGDRVAMVCLL